MNKQTFQIPEGCKAISMEIIDNAIVTTFEPEKQPEFKKGDFVKFINSGNIIILSKYVSSKESGDYKSAIIKIKKDGTLDWDGGTDPIVSVTDEEKQFAIDALAKENKAWDAEKMEIVELKYIPKVGDCVKIQLNSIICFAEITIANETHINSYSFVNNKKNEVVIDNLRTSNGWNINNCTFTKITPEELQAEFNKLGYEYDFETHEAKVLKWKPKNGETYYYITNHISVDRDYYNSSVDELRYQAGNCFKTRAEAHKFKDYILKYDAEKNN